MDSKVGKHKAENVTVTDSGSFFTSEDVEAVLQEIGLTASDDGTYIKISYGATDLLKVRKSDGQLLIAGGVSTDETL